MFQDVCENTLALVDDLKTNKVDLTYQYLDDTFYCGMRNELTDERLIQLNKMAEKIKEPELFGTFIDETHFLETLNLLLHATNETRHRSFFFLKKVMPIIAKHNCFVDIGPGDGRLTRLMGRKFRHISLIDTNLVVLKNLSKKKFRYCNHFDEVRGSIVDVVLEKEHYDLALFSHVLYHIDRREWFNATKKVYSSLVRGGVMVIVLNGDLDKEDLIKEFSGEFLEIDNLINQCALEFDAEINVYFSRETFIASSILPMLHIAGIYLYDAYVRAKKEEITQFLEARYNKVKNLYELTTHQRFILIRKK